MKRQIIASIVIIVALVFGFVFYQKQKAEDTVAHATSSILARCMKEDDHQKCYERDVPKLLGTMSLPQVFEVVRGIRAGDSSYQFCHVLAHKLGQAVVEADPSKWLSAIPFNPSDGLCSNGFIHGVVIGRFRNTSLTDAQLDAATPDFKKACEPHDDWHPSSLDQAICYHGMGHLFDYITDANLKKSLSLCTAVTNGPTGQFTEVCKGGVFMQIYQPLEPEDFELVKKLPVQPTASNYRKFCAAYKSDSIAEGACLHEAWPLFRESIFSGHVKEFCSNQPDSHAIEMCYETASSIVGRLMLEHQDKIIAACQAFPQDGRAICFRATAGAVVEEDRNDYSRALDICSHAGDASHACLEGLAGRARFMFGDTPIRKKFCDALPESLRGECMH